MFILYNQYHSHFIEFCLFDCIKCCSYLSIYFVQLHAVIGIPNLENVSCLSEFF